MILVIKIHKLYIVFRYICLLEFCKYSLIKCDYLKMKSILCYYYLRYSRNKKIYIQLQDTSYKRNSITFNSVTEFCLPLNINCKFMF